VGCFGYPDRSWRGHLLHACGQVHRVSLSRIVHAQIVPDAPHDHEAGVQTQTHLERHLPLPVDYLAVVLHGRLNIEGRVQCAYGMVFMGDRSAEQGHNPVTGELIDGPFVAMHNFRESGEAPVHDLMKRLGIEPFRQSAEPHDIGEEHGDLLALAFQRGLRRQDLLGEVFGGIAVRRPRRRAAGGGHGMSARVAELGIG
jgi:hypothetical protein